MDNSQQQGGTVGQILRGDPVTIGDATHGEAWRGGTLGQYDAADLDRLFGFQTPTAIDLSRQKALAEGARAFAQTLLNTCPPSRQLSQAIEHVRDALLLGRTAIMSAGGGVLVAD